MASPLCNCSNMLSPRCLPRLCHISLGPSSGEFYLSELSLPLIHYVICLCLLLLSAFRFQCGYQWGLNCWGLQCHNPMLYRHMCLLVIVCTSCYECPGFCSFHCFKWGGPSCHSFSCPPAIPSIKWGNGHPMTWSMPSLWWVFNLVILVW